MIGECPVVEWSRIGSGGLGHGVNPTGENRAPVIDCASLHATCARRLSKDVDWKLLFRERNGLLQEIFKQYRDAQARGEIVTYNMIFDHRCIDTFDDWWKSAGAIENGHDWWTRFHAIRRKNVSHSPPLPSTWRELGAYSLEWFILSEWARCYRTDAEETIPKQFSVRMEWSQSNLDQIDAFFSALKEFWSGLLSDHSILTLNCFWMVSSASVR